MGEWGNVEQVVVASRSYHLYSSSLLSSFSSFPFLLLFCRSSLLKPMSSTLTAFPAGQSICRMRRLSPLRLLRLARRERLLRLSCRLRRERLSRQLRL